MDQDCYLAHSMTENLKLHKTHPYDTTINSSNQFSTEKWLNSHQLKLFFLHFSVFITSNNTNYYICIQDVINSFLLPFYFFNKKKQISLS